MIIGAVSTLPELSTLNPHNSSSSLDFPLLIVYNGFMSETTLRNRSYDVYAFYAESGHPITLKDLSAKSDELLGQKVPYETILDWADRDDWYGRVQISFDGSDELTKTKALLDIAYNSIVAEIADGTRAANVSSSAAMFRKMVGRIPKQLWPIVEPQVVRVRSRLFEIIEDMKDKWPRTNISSMAGVWVDLERHVLPELPVEDGATIDLDELVMKEMDAR